MSQQSTKQGGLSGLVETLLGGWLAVETVKAGGSQTGNTADDFPHVTTGVDSDGSTMLPNQWVPGVSNSFVVGGLAFLVAGGLAAFLLRK